MDYESVLKALADCVERTRRLITRNAGSWGNETRSLELSERKRLTRLKEANDGEGGELQWMGRKRMQSGCEKCPNSDKDTDRVATCGFAGGLRFRDCWLTQITEGPVAQAQGFQDVANRWDERENGAHKLTKIALRICL
eukprot:TRINITY_DN64630_c0_g1_i1.p1 TRINITY_DN64630_c0_g1~~TRINITY_DN64630_c0_g1_i1.p1  ORF type:complete len:139 (-),score=11.07 TRINITY_DN64630_c0_g1_i1:55-471(-)